MKEPNIQIFFQDDNDRTSWFIVRHPKGHLNGYVVLSPAHDCYNDEQESCTTPNFTGNDYKVHGGVTWDEKESPIPYVIAYSGHRFIGFDCNHCDDDTTSKDVPFVYAELEKLAKQIEDRARQLRTAQFSEPSRTWMRDLANGKIEYGDFETLKIKVSESEEA